LYCTARNLQIQTQYSGVIICIHKLQCTTNSTPMLARLKCQSCNLLVCLGRAQFSCYDALIWELSCCKWESKCSDQVRRWCGGCGDWSSETTRQVCPDVYPHHLAVYATPTLSSAHFHWHRTSAERLVRNTSGMITHLWERKIFRGRPHPYPRDGVSGELRSPLRSAGPPFRSLPNPPTKKYKTLITYGLHKYQPLILIFRHPVISHLFTTLLSSPDNDLPLPILTYKKYQSFITYYLHTYQPARMQVVFFIIYFFF